MKRTYRVIVAKPYYWLVAVMNKKEGLMTNQKLRQAWQAALDMDPIMKTVAGGNTAVFCPHPSARKVSNLAIDLMNRAARRAGAPERGGRWRRNPQSLYRFRSLKRS